MATIMTIIIAATAMYTVAHGKPAGVGGTEADGVAVGSCVEVGFGEAIGVGEVGTFVGIGVWVGGGDGDGEGKGLPM